MKIEAPKTIKSPSIYWSSFKLLYDDLEDSFRFVNPTENHFTVYSLRFYELLIRASTEFESICKDKVEEFGLSTKKSRDYNIEDYYLLNAHFAGKPGRISIGYIFSEPLFVTPLEGWNSSHSLDWYTSYNSVKHNRVKDFHLASLENVLKSIAALFIIIECCELCPRGHFSYLEANENYGKISSNDVWPVVMRKDYEQ
ncbi:MAG TPA: hypothetical protein PK185_10805 [Cyclobacteriaceae bacterium]|nr:hypothetical protein [Cyclobacteriaceae bacterium]